MYLLSLANRVPERSYTQPELWEIGRRSPIVDQLKPRYRGLLERLLTKPNGVDKRHFALDDIEQLFNRDPEALNREFQRAAPKLAGEALLDALDHAELRASELDALVVCTCTGYLCPGVSSYVAEALGLRPDSYLQDLVGQGCGAAIPALRSAAGILASQPDARVGVIAVEICSAAFYVANDPGVLVSLCLFADGASASMWTGKHAPGTWRAHDFLTLHQPEHRELLRFVNRDGFLRNQLDVSVPTRAATAVQWLYENQRPTGDVVAHAGGREVLRALRKSLKGQGLAESESVLRDFGNLSSPSVLFALEQRLQTDVSDDLWLTSFGAGFAAHSCRLSQSA